ncbi:7,8-didemethyl-8-hydroxy-5-deazariboflavin synthase, partial [Mesorhizobium japonicum]
CELLLSAGADDWGGVSPVTPDHVNPERPWPQLDDLARRTAEAGFRLEERLTIHPANARDPERWLDPAMRAGVEALRNPATALARAGAPAPARPRAGRGP